VLVTHSHNDHFCLASLLRWLGADEQVVVPAVPGPSLLSPDLKAILALAGQASVAPPWETSLRLGDVDVEVLPFYGEQPTVTLPTPHPHLRNWGNCYRFELPDGPSVALIADSGVDATGSAIEALRRSVERRGPIDVLMSCCLGFAEAANPGLPQYLVTIPFDELASLTKLGRTITLGAEGVVDACIAAQARYFLPYAHGFRGLGRAPASGEGRGTEETELRKIADGLAQRGATTRVVPWNPGDWARWERGELVVERV
jgi:hypothetical protein